jgi:flavin-dependent dehydrogenase
MEPIWDLVVVGAGPAGASAALSAVQDRPDARVLLLDREDFPRDKACGDGIAPHVFDVLASVGVVGIETGYAAVDRLRIGFASGPAAGGVMARAAYVIPREVFDARLVREAVHRGAQLRRHRVRDVAVESGHVVLDGEIRARAVVAADGASSVLRRQVAPPRIAASTWPPDRVLPRRFRRKPPTSARTHTAIAIRGYAPIAASRVGQQVIVFTDPDPNSDPAGAGLASWPAYAWSFPIGDGRANVGYGELLTPGTSLSRRHFLDRLDQLLPGAGTDAESWRAHLLPLSTGRPRQPDGRILFAGDAMNLINPVTGEGIFYAVTSGVLAGRAALNPGDLDAGGAYRAEMRRTLGWHFRHTDVANLLASSPAVVRAAIRAADRSSATFNDLVELGLGDGRLTMSTLRGSAAALFRSPTVAPSRHARSRTE